MNNKLGNPKGKEPTPYVESHMAEQHDISQFPIEKNMRVLLREGTHLDQTAVYSALSQELPEEEILEKIEQDYGEKNSMKMIRVVNSELGRKYVRLLIEPSIGCRFDRFIAFATQLKIKSNLPAPLYLRSQFKNFLGKTKLFRVIAVTEDDLASISQQGLISNFYRGKTREELLNNRDVYKSMEYNITDLRARLNIHAGAFATTKNSTLISVSKYPEMAEYAAFVQLKKNWDKLKRKGHRIYLIPIKIDEFNTIRYGEYTPRHISRQGIWSDGKMTIDYNDPNIEALVEFQIPRENINFAKIQEIDANKIPQFKFISDDDKRIEELRKKLKK